MCGLYGMIDYGCTFNGRQKTRILSILSAECEERGTDATGVAYNSRNHLHVYKRPLPAHKFHLTIPNDARVIMGHTRMATWGNAKKNYNNHPFLGMAGNTLFALAHNGVLYNDHTLRKHQKLPKTKIETDSYIAVQLLEKRKALDLAGLKAMAEKVEGSFTFTVLDGRDTLFFVKGDSPLCLVHFPRVRIYLYASTEAILNRAIKRIGLPLGRQERVEVECGELLQLSPDGAITRGEFDPLGVYGRQYRLWSYDLCCFPGNRKENEEYMAQLRAVANSFGYAPGAVDRMLHLGFTFEEIEDFLYCGEY